MINLYNHNFETERVSDRCMTTIFDHQQIQISKTNLLRV